MAGNIAANVTPAARRAEPAPVMSNAAGRTNTPATRILRGLKRVRNSSPNSRVPILELVRVVDGCTGISSVDDAAQAIDRQFGARMRRARRYHDTKAIPAAITASPPEFVKGRSGAASAGKRELRLGSQINISTPSAVKPPPLNTNIRIINANPAPAATRNARPRRNAAFMRAVPGKYLPAPAARPRFRPPAARLARRAVPAPSGSRSRSRAGLRCDTAAHAAGTRSAATIHRSGCAGAPRTPSVHQGCPATAAGPP